MDTAESRHLVTRINELEKELETLKVTSQKQIKESLSKYKRIIDATSEGFLELDPDFKIVDSNATIEGLLGKNKGALLNQPVDSLYDKNSIFVHFASRDHLSFEANFVRLRQEKRSVYSLSVASSETGKAAKAAILFSFTDLTELNKTKEALERQKRIIERCTSMPFRECINVPLKVVFLELILPLQKLLGFGIHVNF